MEIVKSKNDFPIRLTEERWEHILLRHPEMIDAKEKIFETISNPEIIIEGDHNTLIAIHYFEKTRMTSKYLVVIYKESIENFDGFILTAYFANQYAKWRRVLWKE